MISAMYSRIPPTIAPSRFAPKAVAEAEADAVESEAKALDQQLITEAQAATIITGVIQDAALNAGKVLKFAEQAATSMLSFSLSE